MDYDTRYPKTVECDNGKKTRIKIDTHEVEHLHLVVRKNIDELVNMFKKEGFTKVNLNIKKLNMIGKGLNLKLKRPWDLFNGSNFTLVNPSFLNMFTSSSMFLRTTR